MTDITSLKARASNLGSKAKRSKSRFDRTHAGRMIARYGENNGNVLSGGIAYYSLISIAAGLVVGATVISFLAEYIPGVRSAFFSVLKSAVPGLVGSGSEALVSQDATLATTVTGVVGLFALFLGANRATRFIGGLRAGVVTMLGRGAGNPIQGKLRDFAALVGVVLIAIAGLAVQVVASTAAKWLTGLIGNGALSEWLLRVPALLVGLVIDMLFVAMAIMVLGHARAAWRRLWPVLLVTATVIGVLRVASSALVGSAADNAILASIAAVVTLLIFVDFTTRAILMAAAWIGASRGADAHEVGTPKWTVVTRVGPKGRKGSVTTRRATLRV